MVQYIAPEFKKEGFTCPHCGAFSQQEWEELYSDSPGGISYALCKHCKKINIWFGESGYYHDGYRNKWMQTNGAMIYPKASLVPLPNEDINEDIRNDYIEASNIVIDSPRGACALLRLALQKLMVQLGESGKDINNDIGNLVNKGLSPTIQKALDTVRVIGNESVHPGEIDMKDNNEIAVKLFSLINVIANALITQPKEIDEIYGILPDSKIEGIHNRDN